eukprot:m51a1_g11153 hypothetical protein (249) ;mRNA; f:252495-253639
MFLFESSKDKSYLADAPTPTTPGDHDRVADDLLRWGRTLEPLDARWSPLPLRLGDDGDGDDGGDAAIRLWAREGSQALLRTELAIARPVSHVVRVLTQTALPSLKRLSTQGTLAEHVSEARMVPVEGTRPGRTVSLLYLKLDLAWPLDDRTALFLCVVEPPERQGGPTAVGLVSVNDASGVAPRERGAVRVSGRMVFFLTPDVGATTRVVRVGEVDPRGNLPQEIVKVQRNAVAARVLEAVRLIESLP